jgi:cystathionine beta-lyase/cystathionine gamma-synthase
MPSHPIIPPIVLSSTFAFDDAEAMATGVARKDTDIYTRWSNPTITAVEEEIRGLEGADWAFCVGSGMAAIHVALMGAWQQNQGPLLVQAEVYGGTHELVETQLRRLGADVRRAPLDELVSQAAKLGPGATIYLEIPANPTLRVADLRGIRRAAPDATIIVDATFATPVLFQGLAHGADLVVHSASKYLGGHHDLVAGVVSGREPMGPVIWNLRKLYGCCMDPAAAYRLWRGLRTLPLRVRHQNEAGWLLAQRLEERSEVRRVHYPRLPSHPDAERVAELLPDGVGGVIGFELDGGYAAAEAFINRLKHFEIAASLGGTSSLVTWPAGVTHAGMSAEALAEAGIDQGLVRIAVGLEAPELLWQDLAGALSARSTSD